MFLIESKGGAIACMIPALLFLGTWPAILTVLERRGRLPQHTYLDYTIANFLVVIIIALTLGQIGVSRPNMPDFITQLSQDNWPCVLMAMAGGIFLSLGNLSTQYAWAFVGLSVTEVITSSIAVVIGTTLNYFLDDRINKAGILFPGVGCFLVAICLGSAVHSSNSADNAAKLEGLSYDHAEGAGAVQLSSHKDISSFKNKDMNSYKDGMKYLESGNEEAEKAKAGTADFLIKLENTRSIKVYGQSILIGLVITLFAGCCFSLFSPAFNLATNDQWKTMKSGVPHLSPKSSMTKYINDWNGRYWAFFAGILCGLGNGLQFMGGQAAGYAAADAVQALPLVSTFWGILFFGEYRKSSKRTYVLLVSMLLMFIVAVSVLIASSGHRKT
ncbi:Ureide permease [Heracleum sosnowskyi]|uniref:Ureide permease n=1 Tax=Heracleum sosnowskyi TaxID=360622 RepID=A0AAD8MNS9_9APIA|nr:Ureide permease [Heracleum sosnowskyi]